MPAPFVSHPKLTQIAMAVKPEGLIADQVCPRIPVEGEQFVYTRFNLEDAFTVPDTHVGRTSQPNTVEFGGVDVPDQVEDHGLDDVVPNRDINLAEDAANNFDPLGVAAERTALLVELARERRVSDLYFNPATYAANLRLTLSGSSQWNDPASDPLTAILEAFDSMMVRPNVAVFGQQTWTKLRTNPKMVAAVLNKGGANASSAAQGVASRQAIAELLELSEIHVGQGFINTAKKGQPGQFARVWGKHAAFIRIEKSVKDPRGALPTFGFTAQWRDRVSATMDLPLVGLRGSTVVRVGEQVKELVSFQSAGYFFQNAVA